MEKLVKLMKKKIFTKDVFKESYKVNHIFSIRKRNSASTLSKKINLNANYNNTGI